MGPAVDGAAHTAPRDPTLVDALVPLVALVVLIGGTLLLFGLDALSGTIPTLVYYGIQIPSPGWYYAATAIICGAIAMSIGSSWTTAGTIGVGLVGIAIRDPVDLG
jgi:NhaC family Na+:H+ antiporter